MIYGWSPEIGDPTVFGWATVGLYAIAAWLCWRVRVLAKSTRVFWGILFAAMVFLGINKQLDLQSLLTALGRQFAIRSGWYDHRRLLQLGFIVSLIVFGLLFLFRTRPFWRHLPWPEGVAFFGMLLLGVFVLVRAVSFHHVDMFLGLEVLSVRWNVILEMGSTLIVAFGALCARQMKIRHVGMAKLMRGYRSDEHEI